jgi:hypothetical protein
MRKGRKSEAGSSFLLGLICSWLLVGGYPMTVSADSACPDLAPFQGWLPNSTVSYFITGGLDGAELNQVESAFNKWSTHNTFVNCSKVTFYSGFPSQHTISTFNGFYGPHHEAAAVTNIATVSGHTASAITTLYWGAVFPGTTITVWNRNASFDYYRYLLGVTLHEVGHTMGLAHPPVEVPGFSAMNNGVGQNDSAHYHATDVQGCDDLKINEESHVAALKTLLS